jgi:hypothetical protein
MKKREIQYGDLWYEPVMREAGASFARGDYDSMEVQFKKVIKRHAEHVLTADGKGFVDDYTMGYALAAFKDACVEEGRAHHTKNQPDRYNTALTVFLDMWRAALAKRAGMFADVFTDLRLSVRGVDIMIEEIGRSRGVVGSDEHHQLYRAMRNQKDAVSGALVAHVLARSAASLRTRGTDGAEVLFLLRKAADHGGSEHPEIVAVVKDIGGIPAPGAFDWKSRVEALLAERNQTDPER